MIKLRKCDGEKNHYQDIGGISHDAIEICRMRENCKLYHTKVEHQETIAPLFDDKYCEYFEELDDQT